MQVPWKEHRYGEIRVTTRSTDQDDSTRVIHYRGQAVPLQTDLEDLSVPELKQRYSVLEKSLSRLHDYDDDWFETCEQLIFAAFVGGLLILGFDLFGEQTLVAAGGAFAFGFALTFAVPIFMLYSHHYGLSGLILEMTQELAATWHELSERRDVEP